MSRYSKTHSNYVKQKKHQDVTDGYIFERDWVTFGNLHRLEPGKKPFFGDSNFIFTDNSTPVYEKKRGYGKWVARFVYDDVKDAVGDVNEVRVNTNSNDLRSYAYYGSMADLVRVTIEDIIMTFPARLYALNEKFYLKDADDEWVDTHKNKIRNQFMINMHSEGVMLEQYDNELRYLSLSWQDYNIVKYDGEERISEEPIINYEIIQPDIEIYNVYKYHEQGFDYIVYQNHLLQWDNRTRKYVEREYVTECNNYFENCGQYLRYEGVFYTWNDTEGEYTKLKYFEICNDNYQKIATIKITTESNTYFVYAYRINGEVYYACSYSNFSIEPKPEIIEAYFTTLSGLAKKLLNRGSIPLYTAKLLTPFETSSGLYLFADRNYTWPSDGYCLDIYSPSYNLYINSLMDTAEKYDKVYSDCIWRCMTHETIKNFDWTYRREYSENDALENIEGGQRMEELLHFYGFIYDKAKRYVDGIKMTNKISYDGYDNCADAEISDKNNAKGWDVVSTIWEPCYYEKVDFEDVPGCTVEVKIKDYLFDCIENPHYPDLCKKLGFEYVYDEENGQIIITWNHDGKIVTYHLYHNGEEVDRGKTDGKIVIDVNKYNEDDYTLVIDLKGLYKVNAEIDIHRYEYVKPGTGECDGISAYPCLPNEVNRNSDQYISVGCGREAEYYERKCNDPSQEKLTYDYFEGQCEEKTIKYEIDAGECVFADESDDYIFLKPSKDGIAGSGIELERKEFEWGKERMVITVDCDCEDEIATLHFEREKTLPETYTLYTERGEIILEGTIDGDLVLDMSEWEYYTKYRLVICARDCKYRAETGVFKYNKTCKECKDYWTDIEKACGGGKRVPYVIETTSTPTMYYNTEAEIWSEEVFIFDFKGSVNLDKSRLFSDNCMNEVVVKLFCDDCYTWECSSTNEKACKDLRIKMERRGNSLCFRPRNDDFICNRYVIYYNEEAIFEESGNFFPVCIDISTYTEDSYVIEMFFDKFNYVVDININKCYTNETVIRRTESIATTSTHNIEKYVPWIPYSERSYNGLCYVELTGNPSCDLGEGEWDETNTFDRLPYVVTYSSPRFIRVINNYVTKYYMLTDGGIDHTPYTHDKWYSSINPNMTTPLTCDIDYQRRLNISANRIFKTKGTKHAIDMVMGLFGYGRNDKSEFEGGSDYSLTEFYYRTMPKGYDDTFYFYELLDDAPLNHEFTDDETFEELPLNNNENSPEYIRVGSDGIYTYYQLNDDMTVGESVRELYLHRTSEKLYNDWYTGVPLNDYYIQNKHFIVPYYDKKRVYEGNLYFQQKGGWGKRSLDKDFHYDYMETVPYLHVLPSVEDLLSVNSVDLNGDDVYYVSDLTDYVTFDEDVPFNLSHFFKIIDRYNPQRFSSWKNIPMSGEIVYNTNYEMDGVSHMDYVHAKYLNDIVSTILYNNPHVGFGQYDLGEEYFDYMAEPYKYAIENYYFDDMKYNYMARQLNFRLKKHYVTDADYGEFDKVENKISETTGSEIIDESYELNSKVLILRNLNDNSYHKQFMKDVVLKYVMQVIPSTTILILEGFDTDTSCCLKYHNITTEPSIEDAGNVYGSGRYLAATYTVLVAEPNEGYHFVRWEKESLGGNIIISENSTVQVLVCGDDTYIAVFEEDCLITTGCKTTCKMTFECETEKVCSTVFLCETEEQCDINFTCSMPEETGTT